MSNIRIDNIAPSAGGTYRNAPRGIAAAWVNFNGTGTVAIRDSENVGSITDNGTGNFTTNFTNSLADSNFCHIAVSGQLGVTWGIVQLGTLTSSSARFGTFNTGGGSVDSGFNGCTMNGDLA